MRRTDAVVIAVHQAWCAVSIELGETPVSWEDAPEWRKNALQHTIGFWESWSSYDDLDYPPFLAATHFTWMQFHKRHHWTHSDLTPYGSLPADQQKKLKAMLRTYVLFRSFL